VRVHNVDGALLSNHEQQSTTRNFILNYSMCHHEPPNILGTRQPAGIEPLRRCRYQVRACKAATVFIIIWVLMTWVSGSYEVVPAVVLLMLCSCRLLSASQCCAGEG